MRVLFGVFCQVWALVFQISHTRYFGGNIFPETKEELMCDITSLLLCFCGLIFIWSSCNKNEND